MDLERNMKTGMTELSLQEQTPFIFNFLPPSSPLALPSLAEITQKAVPEEGGNDASF